MELTIQVYVTVAVRWLIPRLQAFKAQAPATHVSLNAGLLDWDFNPDHADVGLVYVPKAKNQRLLSTLASRKARFRLLPGDGNADENGRRYSPRHFSFDRRYSGRCVFVDAQ